jgi:hypothetical protein
MILPFVTERLLVADGDLLAAAEDGSLHAYDEHAGAWVRVLDGGKDYDTRGDTLVRLSRESMDFFRYEERSRPTYLHSIPAAGHDYTVALGDRSLFVHSPGNPANVLVVERDLRSGGSIASFLPVDRNLFELVTSDLAAILADAGRIRAIRSGFAFVPLIRDPIEIVGPKRRTALFLAGKSRGAVRTLSQERTPEERACPTCTTRRQVSARQEIRRLYADAAVENGTLWVLRLNPPGGSKGTLYGYSREPTETSNVRSWSVDGFDSPVRAMAIWRDQVVAADDRALHSFDLPRNDGGAVCRSALE